ncbi:hypothetical protein I316_03607 [Kwoniella heveanensis BCC8398]|uniref:Uncharacterized protein n=1 Tax=Kwoniella heveanensis BCC8398 TaxID=1296120 RepID=A0A1B9GU68_9TREE|nr:hypothetical protein I316_03607 [Kwoniella heveanensis BCC8398]
MSDLSSALTSRLASLNTEDYSSAGSSFTDGTVSRSSDVQTTLTQTDSRNSLIITGGSAAELLPTRADDASLAPRTPSDIAQPTPSIQHDSPGGRWLHLLTSEGNDRKKLVLEESIVQVPVTGPNGGGDGTDATAENIPQFRLAIYDHHPAGADDDASAGTDGSWRTGWMTGRRGGGEQDVPGQSF